MNSTLAPYIGRGLLEASLTALLFRVDAFRASTLIQFHSHEDFDLHRPNQISIDWKYDILSEVDDSKDIWISKQKPDGVSRALLSPYQDKVLWQPAFIKAHDYLNEAVESIGFPSLLLDDPALFIKRIRGQAKQIYSFWSKGIHCEFFTIGAHTLDELTCSDVMKRTIDIILELAFVSQFAAVSVGNCSPRYALELYTQGKDDLHG